MRGSSLLPPSSEFPAKTKKGSRCRFFFRQPLDVSTFQLPKNPFSFFRRSIFLSFLKNWIRFFFQIEYFSGTKKLLEIKLGDMGELQFILPRFWENNRIHFFWYCFFLIFSKKDKTVFQNRRESSNHTTLYGFSSTRITWRHYSPYIFSFIGSCLLCSCVCACFTQCTRVGIIFPWRWSIVFFFFFNFFLNYNFRLIG